MKRGIGEDATTENAGKVEPAIFFFISIKAQATP